MNEDSSKVLKEPRKQTNTLLECFKENEIEVSLGKYKLFLLRLYPSLQYIQQLSLPEASFQAYYQQLYLHAFLHSTKADRLYYQFFCGNFLRFNDFYSQELLSLKIVQSRGVFRTQEQPSRGVLRKRCSENMQ